MLALAAAYLRLDEDLLLAAIATRAGSREP